MSDLLHRRIDENTEEFLEQAHASKFDFHQLSVKAAGDEKLKRAIELAVMRQDGGRVSRMRDLPDADALRDLAGEIKQHVLDHLDYYLEQLESNVRRNGGQVHYASTAADARRIIIDIARSARCTRCI